MTAHPVDSTTRTCCGGIGRHTSACNPRVSLNDDGTLDDFFAADVESVHFEALGEAQWYAVVRLRSGDEWMLNFGAVNHRAKGYARAELD